MISKNIHTEILSIGDELLNGTIVDTNAAYIAEQCAIVGLEVTRHSSVGDNLENLVKAIQEISNRADIAIVTGGLGPTFDDLTREAAARAKGVELILFPEALVDIENYFKLLGRNMPEINNRQACFPEGSGYIPNSIGTAPGFSCTIGKAKFFFTPGVPKEMQHMLNENIIPQIQQKFNIKSQALTIKTISTFGASEAIVGKHLELLAKDFSPIKFGTKVSFPETQIKLYARGKEAKALLAKATKKINQQLKEWIFSSNGETMEQIVANLLHKEQATLAIIENCCGRKIAEPEHVKQIAQKVSKLLGVTYSVVITTEEEAGSVHIAISDKNSVHYYSCHLPFTDKEYQKELFSMLALDLLRRKILNIPVASLFAEVV
jgi:nicotinamide-nucleotide amidase